MLVEALPGVVIKKSVVSLWNRFNFLKKMISIAQVYKEKTKELCSICVFVLVTIILKTLKANEGSRFRHQR